LALLAQIGVTPGAVIPADLDESVRPGERPGPHALRLAIEKAQAVHAPGAVTLAADTVVGVGRRFLPKTETHEAARACLDLLSGRAHQVFTGLAVIDAGGTLRTRLVGARVKFKRLTPQEIEGYIASQEWRGKAGGYGVQGAAGRFVIALNGSYTAVVGLPLYETASLLTAAGLRVNGW
jgi:septum formation protein